MREIYIGNSCAPNRSKDIFSRSVNSNRPMSPVSSQTYEDEDEKALACVDDIISGTRKPPVWGISHSAYPLQADQEGAPMEARDVLDGVH